MKLLRTPTVDMYQTLLEVIIYQEKLEKENLLLKLLGKHQFLYQSRSSQGMETLSVAENVSYKE